MSLNRAIQYRSFPQVHIHDAGVDWLTLTWKPDAPDFIAAQTTLQNILTQLSGGGRNVKAQSWQGYVGFSSYSLFAGIREDGFCVRASNHEAKLIEKEFKGAEFRPKCTRIDLQVTAKIRQTETDYARRMQQNAERATANGKGKKAVTIAIYQAAGKSLGVTLGARSSERYCRFYDKSAEQRQRIEPDLWRFEVEFKGQQARMIYAMLMSASNGYWLACSVVKTTFELYGFDMDFCSQADGIELPSTYRQNDDERRLRWLESHVRKTVADLIERGHADEVLQALALKEHLQS